MVDSVGFTTNKCIEGLPGASFTVARVDRLLESARPGRELVVRPVRHLPALFAGAGRAPVHARRRGQSRRSTWRSICSMPRAASRRAWRATPPTCGRCTTGCGGSGCQAVAAAGGAGADRGQRRCAGRSGLEPAALRGWAEVARRADQQFLQHAAAELPGRLHRRGHAGGHAAAVDAMEATLAEMGVHAQQRPPDGDRSRDRAGGPRYGRSPRSRRKAGIPAEALEPYGRYKAKVGLDFVQAQAGPARWQARAGDRHQPDGGRARARPPRRSGWATRSITSGSAR